MTKALLFSTFLFFIHASNGLAGEKPNSDNELLDRLERKLMEQQAASLQISVPQSSQSRLPKGTPIQDFDMPASLITAPLPHAEAFGTIEKELRQLEQDSDEISGQVEKLKSDFIGMAGKANYIEIKLLIEDPDSIILRKMALNIDRQTIYETNDREGDWHPSKEILLYSGPLEAGSHELKLSGKIVRRSQEGLPLDQNLYHLYDQIIKIEIPKGTFHQGYSLKIVKPEKQNIHAQAVMENFQLAY